MNTTPAWYSFTAKAADESADVMIYDVVGAYGTDAASLVRDLKASKAKQINVHLNSPGGSVFDGLAIYNALKAHPADVTTHVDGVAASIASVIAMAGDKVCMAPEAMLMIHNPSAWAAGDAGDLRKLADTLDKCRDNLAGIYAQRTGQPVDQVKAAMDEETWYTADEAKAQGFIDAIDGDDEGDDATVTALATFDFKLYALEPAKLRQLVASRLQGPTPESPVTAPRGAANTTVPPKGESAMDLAAFQAFAAAHPDAVAPLVTEAVNKVRTELAPKAATVAELKAAFPDNAGFVIDQLGANATLAQAKAAYADVIAAENKTLKEQVTKLTNDLAEANKGFGGVRTPLQGQQAAGGATGSTAGADAVIAKFEAAVKAKTDLGMSRSKAVTQLAIENAALMEEYNTAKAAQAEAVRKSRAEKGI